jgi:hypothetical protein
MIGDAVRTEERVSEPSFKGPYLGSGLATHHTPAGER